MTKREYPTEIEHSEWLRRQNYFLEEQNKKLNKESEKRSYALQEQVNTLK